MSNSNISASESELEQTLRLLSEASFPGLQKVLQRHADALAPVAAPAPPAAPSAAMKIADPPTAPKELPASSAVKASIVASHHSIQPTYIPVENFSWDQGGYNSPTVTVYVDLEGVGAIKDAVSCTFTASSFDLKVMGLNGRNYRLLKNNLDKDIIPAESKYVVKKDKVVLKLQKVKGEYSYDHWNNLTAKKSRTAGDAATKAKSDPMGGIMDMMKDMYEEGDDNMRKIIGEAMLKSKRGEGAGPLGSGAPDAMTEI